MLLLFVVVVLAGTAGVVVVLVVVVVVVVIAATGVLISTTLRHSYYSYSSSCCCRYVIGVGDDVVAAAFVALVVDIFVFCPVLLLSRLLLIQCYNGVGLIMAKALDRAQCLTQHVVLKDSVRPLRPRSCQIPQAHKMAHDLYCKRWPASCGGSSPARSWEQRSDVSSYSTPGEAVFSELSWVKAPNCGQLG